MFSLKLGLNLSQEAKKKSRPTGASQQLMAAEESDEDTVSSHGNTGRGWGDVQMSSRVQQQQEEVSPMAASFHDDVSDITEDRFTEAGTEVGGEEVYA